MSMERIREKGWALPVAALGGLAIGLVVGFTSAEASNRNAEDAMHAFERTYTDAGKCLHNTPYDPAKGALLNVNHDTQSNQDVMSALPLAANSQNPSVLFFAIQPDGQLTPGDHNTAGLLEQAARPNQPHGS